MLYEGEPPKPEHWWYYSLGTGQHIGFYQRRTLEVLGSKLGLNVASANGIHIFSKALIDERILGLCTNRWVARLAPWWTRRRLGSKTMADHLYMLNNLP
jgi:hypothetical protein